MAVLEGPRLDEAKEIVGRYPEGRERSAIMPLLYLAQSVEGFVSRDGLTEVAGLLGLTTAEVEAVATFYTMYRLRPTGPTSSTCARTSRACSGARGTCTRPGNRRRGRATARSSPRTRRSLHEEECLGVCDVAPAVQIDFANHDRVTPERIRARGSASRGRGPGTRSGTGGRKLQRGLPRAGGARTRRGLRVSVTFDAVSRATGTTRA